MKYTEEIHAERLLKMLEQKEPCIYCPTNINFGEAVQFLRGNNTWQHCDICRNFINIKNSHQLYPKCPCNKLGKKEAIKRTWLALEEKGYLVRL